MYRRHCDTKRTVYQAQWGGKDSRYLVRVSRLTCMYCVVWIAVIFDGLTLSLRNLPRLANMSLPMSSIPPISVTELMVKKPSCDPVRKSILLRSKNPITASVLISTTSDSVCCFVLPLFLEIIPVVWRRTCTIIFQVRLLRNQPAVNSSCLLLSWR